MARHRSLHAVKALHQPIHAELELSHALLFDHLSSSSSKHLLTIGR